MKASKLHKVDITRITNIDQDLGVMIVNIKDIVAHHLGHILESRDGQEVKKRETEGKIGRGRKGRIGRIRCPVNKSFWIGRRKKREIV